MNCKWLSRTSPMGEWREFVFPLLPTRSSISIFVLYWIHSGNWHRYPRWEWEWSDSQCVDCWMLADGRILYRHQAGSPFHILSLSRQRLNPINPRLMGSCKRYWGISMHQFALLLAMALEFLSRKIMGKAISRYLWQSVVTFNDMGLMTKRIRNR